MMVRCGLALAAALLSACDARQYSESEYKRLGQVLASAGAAAASAQGRSVDVTSSGEASPAAAEGGAIARWTGEVVSALGSVAEARLESLLEDTYTEECRERVTSAFLDTYTRALTEDWLPFEHIGFTSDCDKKREHKKQAPLAEESIRLCYLMIVHESPEQIVRLIEALEEGDRHSFVIHVDAKAGSEATYQTLLSYAATRPQVHVLEAGRMSVSWGGFNVVQATLNAMAYILDHLGGSYDWIATMSGYTYPLASNREIRKELSRYPRDANFLEVRPTPNDPQPRAWHQFVECDDRMRRIWRLQPAKRVSMYMGSQWMIVTEQFASYAVGKNEWARGVNPHNRRPTFAREYHKYAQHVMVADENFFTTLIKNAPMCDTHVNNNFLHVQFDQWENEKDVQGQNDKKCLQPNPKHCGRSPTTLTLDYLPVLELGRSLFARKFDVKKDVAALDAIDVKRRAADAPGYVRPQEQFFAGVRIARKEKNGVQTCLTIGHNVDKGTKAVHLRTCDANNPHQRFNVGPCSSDGHVELRDSGGPALVTPGAFAPAPFCPISASTTGADSNAKGPMMCLDLKGEQIQPGTPIIAYHCNGRWNQLFGLGTGAKNKPDVGSLFINIPYAGHPVSELCLDAEPPKNSAASAGVPVSAEECDGSFDQTFSVEPL